MNMKENIPVVTQTPIAQKQFTLQDGEAELGRFFIGDITKHISDATVVLDDVHRIVYLNEAAQHQYDVSAADVTGQPVTEMFQYCWRSPDDEARMKLALDGSGYWRGESMHVKRSGESIHVECSVSRLPVREGTSASLFIVIRDITERKLQEERTRRNELRLRLALDAAYMISFEWDIQRDEVRRFQSTSPVLPQTSGENLGTFDEVRQVVHPEDSERFTTNVYAALAREDGHYENEFRIVQPDGSVGWLYEYGRVERDSEGQPAYLIGLSQDITERKLNEILLLQSQRRYAGIVASAMDAIVTVDAAQHIQLFNTAAEEMFACPATEAIGGSLERFMPERFRQHHAVHLHAFGQGADTSRKMGGGGFVTGLRANGEEFPVEASISQIEINGEKSFTAILRDISERKQTEDKLRESEERMRLFIEHAPVSIAMFDREMRYLAVSNRWKEDFHLSLDLELTGQSHYEIFPEIPERWKVVHRRGLAGETLQADEDPFERLDGTTQWVKWEVLPWFSADGQVGGILTAAEEITERVQVKKELQEANRRKDEFLAMLAHELRNPLAPISNAVQILRMTGPQNPTLEQTTGMIGRQVNQLVRLVDDLLDVSRVSRGKIKLQKELLDLAVVVHQAVETSQPLLESRQHTLNVTLPSRRIRVEGDFTRLAQVISNLLNNAAKYTDAGGTIDLAVEQQIGDGPDASAQAIIRVRDNGRGIDPAVLDSLFDLFYQVDRNLDRSEGGLGIGLSLVKNIIDMHGGHVEAHSTGRGNGSEFIIRLPCLPEEQPAGLAGVADNQPQPAAGQRILLVDDNPDVAESMSLLLSLYGHEVLVAHDGREAVEVALRERPALVLLDIGLPYLDGYQACQAMRNGGLAATLIVALSGYGQDDDRRKAKEAGFDRHMAKPVDMEALEELLASLSHV